jgi:hypothetical protein
MKVSSAHRGHHNGGYGAHPLDTHHAVQGRYLALCGVKDPARYTLEKLSVTCPICRVNLFLPALEPSEERLRRALWTFNPVVGVKPRTSRESKANLDADPRALPSVRGTVPMDVARQLRRTMYRKSRPVRVHKAGASVIVTSPERGQ